MTQFINIKQGDCGEAVLDVQQRLKKINLLSSEQITGKFDKSTENAIKTFSKKAGLEELNFVNEEVWEELVLASYSLGDRTLYLRMPHFKGADCKELQHILGVLGFSPGAEDGDFGSTTESALRIFQNNMGLPNDGIVGAFTYQTIQNLHHSWDGKEAYKGIRELSFSRAAKTLETHTVCLFGTCEFTRSVARRMSNLAIATTPQSKVLSADALSVFPDNSMILIQINLSEQPTSSNRNVIYSENDIFNTEITNVIKLLNKSSDKKFSITLKSKFWGSAKEERSAQHYAINLLDSLCFALSHL